MSSVDAKVVGDSVQISIPADYLERAFEFGVTTNVVGKVCDRAGMLEYVARKAMDGRDDCEFGRFVDALCQDAIESGELFVDVIEDCGDV